jgi:hypothetical protein
MRSELVVSTVSGLLRRADAARSLVARGELEPFDALRVVLFPTPDLLALEGPTVEPEQGFFREHSTFRGAPRCTRRRTLRT